MEEQIQDLIQYVGFVAKAKYGCCIRCGENAPVIEITAIIQYPTHGGMMETLWSVEYCLECLKYEFKKFEDNKETLVGYS